MTKEFDVIVIGAGPGGYVSAIRSAQLGKSVAIIEKQFLGGTCLNVGCIPSKLLLEFGNKANSMNHLDEWGIKDHGFEIDFSKYIKKKTGAIQALTGGVKQLLNMNGVTYFKGEAIINDDLTVNVNDVLLHANNIVIATGSKPFIPPIDGIESISYETTDSIFNLKELPNRLAVIGGGVIATELASALADLGVDVTIIEVAEDILTTEVTEVKDHLKNHLKSQNIRIITNAKIQKVDHKQVILEKMKKYHLINYLLQLAERLILMPLRNLI